MKEIVKQFIVTNFVGALFLTGCTTLPAQKTTLLTGQGANGDWSTDAPGVRRKITVADLPKPYLTQSVNNGPKLVPRPAGAMPVVKPGFKVEEFASGLKNPRLIRRAPNGDLFVAESQANLIRV